MSIIVLRKYGNAHTWQKTEEKPRFLGALRRGSEGRSILLLVDIDARNVFEAVPEFFHCEHQCAGAVEREDVRPQTRGVIRKMDESEELSCALGAFERVVCEVCEVALDGSFVGKYHI
mgnify:FL=1